jgi:hypothetical protein
VEKAGRLPKLLLNCLLFPNSYLRSAAAKVINGRTPMINDNLIPASGKRPVEAVGVHFHHNSIYFSPHQSSLVILSTLQFVLSG